MTLDPVLPGCYPDPSVCRVGSDFYLVNSSFEYFPALPVHHSRDLVHWRQIGHVLDRTDQVSLEGIRCSGGLYAPTIRYHDGVFYVVCTLVDGDREQGNFVVTATDPAGPWSQPHWLPEAKGFDPSLSFDDGRAWLTGCREVADGYPGQTEVWLRELDLATMALTGREWVIWHGAMRDAVWAEGPHLYKVDGRYVLVCAEGGTDIDHAVVVARAESVTGPYVGSPRNPVFSHRHLGRDHPIVGVGHADLVRDESDQWWAVFLAMRPYGGYFYNLGRETFLTRVRWEDGWPLFDPLPPDETAPDLTGSVCDHFDRPELGQEWNVLRTPEEPVYSLTERPGFLRLRLRPETLAEPAAPAFVGRRQQHMTFTARCVLEFQPAGDNERAGLALLQNNDFHVLLVRAKDRIVLSCRQGGVDETLAEVDAAGARTYLGFEAQGQSYQAVYAIEPGQWRPVGPPVDGRMLSTPVAGGFTGVYIGMYASALGLLSESVADFGWFEYHA
ncbi:glycoside hydrolase family 43 protein [Solihabitans fulvus]|uniref:Glycoside hydrolase family 43 protein n=1 Tax=Solihabitans fulvus TaxID=1892852 RepID=A0A5B2WN59_9PSEU|nr:glycoside hydrolase family 43 protein [Solihabitans fulvus]KAA2252210.1 glycoside hydrolase family 43 protein [Solihabitans fulvus]